jgi:hypothetical protein
MRALLAFTLVVVVSCLADSKEIILEYVPVNGQYYQSIGDIDFFIMPGVADQADSSTAYWVLPFVFEFKNNSSENVIIHVTDFYLKDESGLFINFLYRDEAINLVNHIAKMVIGRNEDVWTKMYVGDAIEVDRMRQTKEGVIEALSKIPADDISLDQYEQKHCMMATPKLENDCNSFTIVFAPEAGPQFEISFSKLKLINNEKYYYTKKTIGFTCSDTGKGTCVPNNINTECLKPWGFSSGDFITSVNINGDETEIYSANHLEALLRSAPENADIKFTTLRNNQTIIVSRTAGIESN